MRRFLPLLLLATACGNDKFEKQNAPQTTTPFADSADASLQTESCDEGETRYGLVPQSKVSWVVVKEGGVAVVGTHPVAGKVSLRKGEPLSALKMSLAFGLDGNLSDLPLRDERLRKYVFGTWQGFKLRFVATGATGGDVAAGLGEQGQTASVSLQGNLEVAGRTVPVNVPILVTPTSDGGLEVTEGDNAVLDLRTDLGLGAEVDAVMALVDKHLDGSPLRLRFHLRLEDLCEEALE